MSSTRLAVFALLVLAATSARASPPSVQPAVVVLADLGTPRLFGLDRMRAFLGPHSELQANLANEYCNCLGYAPPDSPDKAPDTQCLKEIDRIEGANTSLVAVWLFPHVRGWKTVKVLNLGAHDGRLEFEIFGNRGRKVRLALESMEGVAKSTYFDLLEINGSSIETLLARERSSGQLCASLKTWSTRSGLPRQQVGGR